MEKITFLWSDSKNKRASAPYPLLSAAYVYVYAIYMFYVCIKLILIYNVFIHYIGILIFTVV